MTGIGGSGGKRGLVPCIVFIGDVAHRVRCPTVLRHLCSCVLAVAVDFMLRLADGHAAAVAVQRAVAVVVGAGGGDGVSLVIRRVRPVVRVLFEDQLRAVFDNNVAVTLRVRRENIGVLQRVIIRTGGDLDGRLTVLRQGGADARYANPSSG